MSKPWFNVASNTGVFLPAILRLAYHDKGSINAGPLIDMDVRTHWEKIYAEKAPNVVSWYRPHLETSLALIEQTASGRSASVIDIGGGESTLVDDLLARGYENISKRPPVAVAQSSDFEFLQSWGPEDHKVVLAEFAICGLQRLWWAIALECFFSGMEAFFWQIGQNEDIEFATPKVMAINL
jgi:hypothetical protein